MIAQVAVAARVLLPMVLFQCCNAAALHVLPVDTACMRVAGSLR
jgi:hypothetical protein